MTIEAQLEEINETLKDIVVALTGTGPVPEKPPAKKPTGSSSGTQQPTTGSKRGGKKQETAASAKDTDGTPAKLTKEDVRKALQALQKSTDASTAKAVLKKYGATTLGTLDADQYYKVIEACVNGTK